MDGVKRLWERNSSTNRLMWPTSLTEPNLAEWQKHLDELEKTQPSNEYLGNVFDFFPGINVQLSIEFEEVKRTGNDVIEVTFNDITGDSSGNMPRTITMSTLPADDTGNIKISTIVTYQGTSAHEFGHILGLTDAYARKNSGYVPISHNEFNQRAGDVSAFDVPRMPYMAGMMGNGKGLPTTNDVEMMLYTSILPSYPLGNIVPPGSTDRNSELNNLALRQLYTPIWERDVTARDLLKKYGVILIISYAIREKQLYTNGTLYVWCEHCRIMVTFRGGHIC
jgi:hypothetical protein